MKHVEFTIEQQLFFDGFNENLKNKKSKLYPSNCRGWGKTTILNEIGFTYQTLGYEVLLITECPYSNEYYATKYIDNEYDLIGLRRDKVIALIDEYNLLETNKNALIEKLKILQIPYVGFIKGTD